MITLEDVWYSNINPHEQFIEDNEKLKELGVACHSRPPKILCKS